MSAAPAFTDDDRLHMQRALALATGAIGLTDPNPRVGCVIVGPGWTAEGHTQPAGQPHAEPMALRAAQTAGHDPRGATVYVTLEPCAHHGRTPPCCDALVAAGVGRVVVALVDPNPLVGGEGLRRLRAAGIAVEVGLLEDEARELNIGFLHRMRTGRPFVRLKVAASLDGRTALEDGRSQWITGPSARADGHAFRRRAGAVLTGIGTVLADDPRLDVREVPTPRQPLRVLIDARLQLPATARIADPPGELLICCADAGNAAADAWRARGVQVQALPCPGGRIELEAVLQLLGERQINELHVEAGPRLNADWLQQGLVDELLLYQAPMFIGTGRPIAEFLPLEQLTDATRWRFVEHSSVGDDLRLRLRPLG